MDPRIQQQLLRTFDEHKIGLYTPSVLLRRLGTCLLKPLSKRRDLYFLTEGEAKRAIELIPELQSPCISTEDVARMF